MIAWAAGGIALGIVASALFSGAETGAYQFNRTRLRLALADGGRQARLVNHLTSDLTAFVVVCLIGTNLANNLVSFASILVVSQLAWGPPELIATLAVAPFLFVLGELGPKELFRRQPDRFLYGLAPVLALAAFVFRPFVLALGVLTWLLQRLGLKTDGDAKLRAEDRIRLVIEAGAEGGALTEYQETLARNIFSLNARTVQHTMIAIAEVDALEASAELEEARNFARLCGRRHMPVFRRERDQVVGVVNLFDLLFEELPGLTIRNYIQPALELRPGEPVTEALLRMRRARTALAVVMDQGKAVGVVTLKDLVEEITGELQDL
ncbi:MAG: DUF21 domain-containing protein [Planctomycetes bacterium]|nr:DUF21 domain-containing protein [Planctomycetota bacterium]